VLDKIGKKDKEKSSHIQNKIIVADFSVAVVVVEAV